MIKQRHWWLLSSFVSTILIMVLIYLWIQMNNHEIKQPQLINADAVTKFIDENWLSRSDTTTLNKDSPPYFIKTGIYIQSLNFNNSTDVNLTGYIWQKYPIHFPKEIIPQDNEVGFILPEQVNSGFEPQEVYRIEENDTLLIGWYFEATLRQPFKYLSYPFDHKTVWVKMWPKDFSENIILLPDFNAYKSTGLTDIFGIDENIVLGTWQRKNTFFNYQLSNYESNFGISDYIGQQGFPELRYNFVVKRKFENAFIVYLLPLFLVATLLFAAMLTVSDLPGISARFGFNTSGFISASSALFFVVMLAHIQLRKQFSGSGIVYIEYFYILMYLVLVITTANTYLFSIRTTWGKNIILYNDNIIPKILYWPVLMSCLIIITLFVIEQAQVIQV